MITQRINDPTGTIDDQVDQALTQGLGVTVQFSHECYSPAQLRYIDGLCQKHGTRIEVRFYDHFMETFDASILDNLPHVRWLTLGNLQNATGIEKVAELSALEMLAINVTDLDDPNLLDALPLEQLSSLTIAQTKKKNINLAPLSRAVKLHDLFIQSHTKNIEAVRDLPQLASLGLSSMPNRLSLEFVNDLGGLKSLLLIIGGRASIDEVRHARLEKLSILQVKALASLGDLTRFPALKSLQVEDQLQLNSLSLHGPKLRSLNLFNCRGLAALDGLEAQDQLEKVRIGRTALDVEALLAREWPETLKQLDLFCSSEKQNAALRAQLDQKGYERFSFVEA